VVLEHAMLSYSSLWQGGRHVWQIRHHLRHGGEHLEVSGDVPAGFAGFRDMAIWKPRAQEERRKPDWRYFDAVDYVFDVPLDALTSRGALEARRLPGPFSMITGAPSGGPTVVLRQLSRISALEHEVEHNFTFD
jgi:hypothetical protein